MHISKFQMWMLVNWHLVVLAVAVIVCLAVAIIAIKGKYGHLIKPVKVQRDEYGYWSHPGIPDFDEDGKAYRAWLVAQRLVTSFAALEDEDDSHPVRQAYWPDDPMQESSASVVGWDPEPPAGEGWFVLSIHDTEDGPYFVWARRITEDKSIIKAQPHKLGMHQTALVQDKFLHRHAPATPEASSLLDADTQAGTSAK